MLSIFSEALARIPGLGAADLHEAQRSAKLLRRRMEAGRRPSSDDEWAEFFPDPAVMRLAQIHLDEGPGTPVFDPEATLTGEDQAAADDEAEAVDQEAWYEFLSDLPEEGLPRAGGGERVDSWQLGRMIYNVSRGFAEVDFDDLPVAGGFRERFVKLAHRTGRLDCIRGLPRSA